MTISLVAVPTRDRPDGLQEVLGSLLTSTAAHGHTPEVLVVDDGSSAEVSERIRAELIARGGDEGVVFRLCTRGDRARYVEELARTGIDPALARFALLDDLGTGYAPGACRNTILLDAQGERVLTVDDDMPLLPGRPPGHERGAPQACDGDPTELWFFGDAAATQAAIVDGAVDLLAEHDDALGRPIGGKLRPPADLPADSLLAGKLRHPDSHIAATWTGFGGDIATPNVLLYLVQEGDSRRRLLASEAAYRDAYASRQAIRSVRRSSLGTGAFWTPGVTAYDTDFLLPPFLPVGRGEGLVWGALVRSTLPHLVAYLPVVVPHIPAERRTFAPSDLPRYARSCPLATLLCRAIEPLASAGADDGLAQRRVGRALTEIGRLAPAAFDDHLSLLRRAYTEAMTEQLQGALTRNDGSPRWWAADVERFLAALQADGPAIDPSLAGAQRIVELFGRLLEAWPDLLEAAWQLRERGIRVSATVE